MAAPVYILTSPYRRTFGSQSAHYQGTIRALSGRSRLRSAPFVLYRLTFFSYSSHIGLHSGHCLLTSGSLSCCCRVTIGSLVKIFSYSSHIGLQSGHCLLTSRSLSCCCRVTIGSLVKTCLLHTIGADFTADFHRFLSAHCRELNRLRCKWGIRKSIGGYDNLVMDTDHISRNA